MVVNWSDQALAKLRRVKSPAEQRRVPRFRSTELDQLAASVEQMRQQLKASHVEHYVHSLTHELKSPLTAIKVH